MDDDELMRDAAAMRPVPAESSVRALSLKATYYHKLEDQIEELEDKLKKLKEQRYDLQMRELPEMMDAAGTDSIGIPGQSLDLVVKPYYKAVIPKETAAAAAAWLDEHGFGDIIATFVSVQFSKGEREHAVAVLDIIENYFRTHNIERHQPEIETSVHWKTLTSFVKEQVERGEVLPLDILGATVGRIAEIKTRK